MAVDLTQEDLEFLLDLVSSEDELRDSSGLGNNLANPAWGAADQPFIRLTAPSYADGINTPRETVNTPREISDLLVNQDTDGDGVEESIPNQFGGNAFLTFFGQYFDHGLDFVGKSGPGQPIGSESFPIGAQRAMIMPGTGNADGIAGTADDVPAQHINKTSPFVDQNQAYGSNDAVTDLLRRWETGANGEKLQTAYLLAGEVDATGRSLLPTLNHIRENYRIMTDGGELTSEDISNFDGTGHALLIDFIPVFSQSGVLDLDAIGHYYVAGDGRANENVMLTSIHTIWARNHNFWVDELKEKTGGAWTEEQYFQAARVVNIAEYQRVVFTEFADAMAGGLNGGGTHGFGGYDPSINASISAEFAHVAYRFGHSMLNETVSYVDQATGELAQTSLVNAFLSPQNVAGLGVANLIQGATAVEHQAIDIHMVNALRNQLVGRPLDLAALNIFRGRDTGVGTLNEVRAELFAKTGDDHLRPYADWEDFQDRNDISDEIMDKLKAAYPEGLDAVDLWVGGLLEEPREGQLGSTFAFIFLDQLDRLQEGDRFYYLHQLEDADFRDQINDQSFAEIIARNTGLTDLPQSIFEATSLSGETPVDPPVNQPGEENGNQDGEAAAGSEATQGADNLAGGSGNDELIGLGGNDELHGGGGNDDLSGGSGNDELFGDAGNDELHGGDGNDELHGGSGNDELFGDAGQDALRGGAGHDLLEGGAGHDELYGEAGDDELHGGGGDDLLEGGEGDDLLDGGEGEDTALYSGNRAEYQVVTHEDGSTTVSHLNGGADEIDTLTDVEYLQFSDIVIDTPPAAATPGEIPDPDPVDDPDPEENPAPVNHAPTSSAIAGQTAQPGAAFSLDVSSYFADEDTGDTLTYSMSGPAWLSIDAQTGQITGTPPSNVTRQALTANADGAYAVPAGGIIEISTEFFANTAGYNNSFGYYLADASGKPLGGAIVENSVRTLGEKTVTVDLGDHAGAVSVGFFIIPDGAKKNGWLADGDEVEFKLVKHEWRAFAEGKILLGQGEGIYFTDKALNGDCYDHVKDTAAAGNLNWEDLKSGGDKNFNDANVQVSVKAVQTGAGAVGGDVVVTVTDSGGLTAQASFAIDVPPVNLAQGASGAAAAITDDTPSDGTLCAVVNQPLSALLQPLFDAGTIAEIRTQWQSSSDGQTWRPVPGATNMRYTPRNSEIGMSLRAALTYIFIDSAFSPQTVYSEPTTPVSSQAPSSNGSVSGAQSDISGAQGVPTVQGGEGNDRVDDDEAVHTGNDNHDGVLSDAASDANVIHGSSGANLLFGSRGEDLIFAKAAKDIVHAGRGNDIIHGGDGNDMLFGGVGDDTLFGEAGDDHLFGGAGKDKLFGGEGDDRLHGGEGADNLSGDAGDDALYGDEGDDTLSGGEGEDALDGGKGNDALSGGAGADLLSGGAGDDQLNGGAGNDTLLGGSGNDIIAGGIGNDILYGGTGRDTFVYRAGDGDDAIMDFEDDADELQFDSQPDQYTVSATDYGQDYVFSNGQVLTVHRKGHGSDGQDNSGPGSGNSGSGSGNSGSGSGNSGPGSGYNSADDELDFDDSSSQSLYVADGEIDEWAELVVSGIIEPPGAPIVDDYPPLSDLYDDPGLSALLGISTIAFSHEDTNLIC